MFYDLHGNQINLFSKGQAHGCKAGSKEGVSCAVQAGLVLPIEAQGIVYRSRLVYIAFFIEADQGIKNHKGSWTLNYDKSVLEREMGRKIKLLKF